MLKAKKLTLLLLSAFLCVSLAVSAVLLLGGKSAAKSAPIASAAETVHSHSWSHSTQLTASTTELSGGNYYLAGDVGLTEKDITVTGNVEICLNGHKLKGTGSNSVITVDGSGASLTLYDCNENANDGTITGGTSNGGVYIIHGASFTMKGGVITKNESSSGGGVKVLEGGTFTMDGGTISENDGGTEYH